VAPSPRGRRRGCRRGARRSSLLQDGCPPGRRSTRRRGAGGCTSGRPPSAASTAGGSRGCRFPCRPSLVFSSSRTSAMVGVIRQPSFMTPAWARCWIQEAPARVLPAPRPATYAQTRQSPAGGRWLVRARGCARHSPGGRPHEHDWAYQSQGERSVTRAATGRLRASTRKTRAFFMAYTVLLLELGDALFQPSEVRDGHHVDLRLAPTRGSQPGAQAGRRPGWAGNGNWFKSAARPLAIGRGSKPVPFGSGCAPSCALMGELAEKAGENRQKRDGKWRQMAVFRGSGAPFRRARSRRR